MRTWKPFSCLLIPIIKLHGENRSSQLPFHHICYSFLILPFRCYLDFFARKQQVGFDLLTACAPSFNILTNLAVFAYRGVYLIVERLIAANLPSLEQSEHNFSSSRDSIATSFVKFHAIHTQGEF